MIQNLEGQVKELKEDLRIRTEQNFMLVNQLKLSSHK